jgi:hypothetical protein
MRDAARRARLEASLERYLALLLPSAGARPHDQDLAALGVTLIQPMARITAGSP